MRVLLLHPEDSPRRGPWTRQRWDLIVDLGKSSAFSQQQWSQLRECPVLRSEDFRQGIEDVKRVGEMFSLGTGRLVDEEGIDWWKLTNLLFVQGATTVLVLRRALATIPAEAEIWATRGSWPLPAVSELCGRPVRSFDGGALVRPAHRVRHYAGLARRFRISQLKDIVFDKYDSGYQWRSHFSARVNRLSDASVLVPSAYENVSRMATAYASQVMEQPFLMVATRYSARQFSPPANMQVRDLSAYAQPTLPGKEIASLIERWKDLRINLEDSPDLSVMLRCGVLDGIPAWLRDGLCVRNAWKHVLETEPICGVLCGDDSNRYTLLPVLLAARKNIPTVDFHHGAFDGRYLLKELPCDVYLAKSEMERDYLTRLCQLPRENIQIASSVKGGATSEARRLGEGDSIVFFSEPYEGVGMRTEEVYREILPPLLRIACEFGRSLIVKLHPFESRSQRARLIEDVVGSEDATHVSTVDGPLTAEFLSRVWFGITVESTTVMDCTERGVPCFLCGWLSLSDFGYTHQFARFGVGEILGSAGEICEISGRLDALQKRIGSRGKSPSADPETLRSWLTGSHRLQSTRPVS